MAAYQQGTKRQKVREVRENDYFQGVDKIEYSNMASAGEAARYRYYNSGERVHNKTMEEWLKFSVSLTHFRGSDSHSRYHTRPWHDNADSLENHKRCIKALFEFCAKLGVKYWTAFDTDLIPVSDNWDEIRASWDEMVEYVGELNQRYHLRLLWLAPDLHSHPRYTSGASTSNDATTFTQAAAQIKKCIEISQRLNAECFLIWPYREGYISIFNTDVAKEIKLFSKLLKITAEYKDKLSYRCNLVIMPYGCCRDGGKLQRSSVDHDAVYRYVWDVTSCLYFLKSCNLDRFYKVCTPPGHHMYMANVYNMLAGVTISNDVDQCNTKNLTLMMKCIVDQGTAPPGGINLRLTPRQDGDLKDMVISYVKYVDAIAKGLRFACNLLSEQMFSKHLQQRYSTYQSGFGSRLISNDISMEECEEYHKKSHGQSELASSKCEQVELAFQRYIDTSDHI